MNKKSVYRQIQFTDVKDKNNQMTDLGLGQTAGGTMKSGNNEISNKMIAEKIVS